MAAASSVASVMTPGDDDAELYICDRQMDCRVGGQLVRRTTEVYDCTIADLVRRQDAFILVVRDLSDAQLNRAIYSTERSQTTTLQIAFSSSDSRKA